MAAHRLPPAACRQVLKSGTATHAGRHKLPRLHAATSSAAMPPLAEERHGAVAQPQGPAPRLGQLLRRGRAGLGQGPQHLAPSPLLLHIVGQALSLGHSNYRVAPCLHVYGQP